MFAITGFLIIPGMEIIFFNALLDDLEQNGIAVLNWNLCARLNCYELPGPVSPGTPVPG
jgi:hypothetical protein